MLAACKKNHTATGAFYYWKSSYQLDSVQQEALQQAAGNRLYLHFFDIGWIDAQHRAVPQAVVQFTQTASHLNITPVVYITNKVFENIADSAIDSLARNTWQLVYGMCRRESITWKTLQTDCDWTLNTRDKYFTFLRVLKRYSHKQLEATIRLHQVKYKERTGVPPVDKGILMYYNMGSLDANIDHPSSIYNEADAAKYIASVPRYPLQLDVALPVFSWAVHIRNGRVIQLYSKTRRSRLQHTGDFEQTGRNVFRATHSFFMGGTYVKENDIFKLEETGRKIAEKAAHQLAAVLPMNHQRTIVYYELSTFDPEEYQTKDFIRLSDCF
ncbi:hypothetical protein SAMN05421788_11841 [Filimonas lacunae]|uniref:Uncharacterized protein n=2 Tax=Filimonas lacunae TaxID=477680 RepID=A0A1N7RHQ9_9BACT|nr:hypothetical protein SAMN05421788_11841 [Filimonas lacunae]